MTENKQFTLVRVMLWVITTQISLCDETDTFVITNNYCITNGSSALSFCEPVEDIDLNKIQYSVSPSSSIRSVETEGITGVFTLWQDFCPKHVHDPVQEIPFFLQVHHCARQSEKTSVSQIYPEPEHSMGIDCNINETSDCTRCWTNGKWTLQNSIDGRVNQLITDWRWEELKLFKTENVDDKGKELKFYNITSINKTDDFRIPFSVRIENEGHVFLCDGPDATTSTCYWLLLGGWKGSKSALRFCKPGYIKKTYGDWPGPPCTNYLSEKKHFKGESIVSEEQWSHFIIIKNGRKLSIVNSNKNLLEYTESKYFLPAYIIFHSKRVDGLWKLHKYEYVYTEEATTQRLGPEYINIGQGENCISLFVITCSVCELILRLFPYNDYIDYSNDLSFNKVTTPDEKWTEIKLFIKTEKAVSAVLFVTTAAHNPLGLGQFWAIDHVRQCSRKEFRYIRSGESYTSTSCQLVENQYILNIDNGIETSKTDKNCPEDTFGSSCIPCPLIDSQYPFCQKVKYCEIVDNNNKQCYCSSGYMTRDCSVSCYEGHYGHGCSRSCGNCATSCNHITGICKDCSNGYIGDKCDILPGLLLSPPKIMEVGSRYCIVRLTNFSVTGNTTPPYYIIQYKEVLDTYWHRNGEYYAFMKENDIPINSLKPDTGYYVRAVLYDLVHLIESDTIKNTYFRTKCIPIMDNNIDIESSTTSAKARFKLDSDSCNINNYIFTVSNTTIVNEKLNQPVLNINILEPCREYTIYFKHIISNQTVYKNFTTLSVVPLPVINAEVRNTSATTAFITWEEPSKQKCKIIRYDVIYKRIQGLGCLYDPSRIMNDTTLSVNDTRAILSDLKPYSHYEVTIAGVTEAGPSESVTLAFETLSSDSFNDEEIPSITNITKGSTNIYIYISQVNCDKIQGLLYVRISMKCLTDWCSEENTYQSFNLNTSPPTVFSLSHLWPHVNYAVLVNVSRSINSTTDSYARTLRIFNITTMPAVPNTIQDIEVVSKDTESISLRWLPPFPPTGILNMYEIKYWNKKFPRSKETSQSVVPSPCRLWPNYHCVTITKKITSNSVYIIQIWATNTEPGIWKEVSKTNLSVKAVIERPDPPFNISTEWAEDNTLQISWTHPNVTNGVVRKFSLELNTNRKTSNKFIMNISSEDDYELIYHYQMKNGYLWCTPYKVNIKTHNQRFVSEIASSKEETSPPAIPRISNKNIETISSNSTITIIIPKMKQEDVTNTKFFILISESLDDNIIDEELNDYEDSLRNRDSKPPMLSHVRLVFMAMDIPTKFQIGNASDNASASAGIKDSNPPLQCGKEYTVILLYVNECYGKVRLLRLGAYATTKESNSKGGTKEDETGNNGLYALLLLVLIPLVIYIYVRKNKEAILSSVRNFTQPRIQQNVDTLPLTEKPPIVRTSIPTVIPQITSPDKTRCVSFKSTYSKPIKISEYESYVKESILNGELERQHALFPRGQTQPWEYGALKVNKLKNRYNNLIAYDHTRVKLRKIAGVEYSDYINANYIDGYRSPKAYIATQGPKASTVNDFWRMVWQHNVENIVMLANIYEGGKKKVEKYWPDINEDKEYNGIRVQYISSQVFADYEYRIFNVSNNDKQRKVEQFHFTSWPDHGVPLYSQSLVPFLQRLLKIPNSSHHPVVIHCSAGVGRTGTIILCDICLRMAAGEGSIDALANLERLRSQRPNMVDNIEQYKLAHLTVLECLFGMQTYVDCDDEMEKTIDSIINSGGLRKYMRYLEDTKWQDKAMDTVWAVTEIAPVYPEKNRFKEIVPEHQHRVFLLRYPVEDHTSSYINAVHVDGFRSPGRYIVTQQPMPNTLGDFWRLVAETKAKVIISLNEIRPNDKTSCEFWPTREAELNPVDFLSIRHVKTIECDCYNHITVDLNNKKEGENISITMLFLKNWVPGTLLPESIEIFLSFWEESYSVSRNSHPIIVTCHDGATASGLYVAMSFVIEKMTLEHVCDVCLAVRNIRHSRPQFVTSEKQFEFLYRASETYINGFQSYANFVQ